MAKLFNNVMRNNSVPASQLPVGSTLFWLVGTLIACAKENANWYNRVVRCNRSVRVAMADALVNSSVAWLPFLCCRKSSTLSACLWCANPELYNATMEISTQWLWKYLVSSHRVASNRNKSGLGNGIAVLYAKHDLVGSNPDLVTTSSSIESHSSLLSLIPSLRWEVNVAKESITQSSNVTMLFGVWCCEALLIAASVPYILLNSLTSFSELDKWTRAFCVSPFDRSDTAWLFSLVACTSNWLSMAVWIGFGERLLLLLPVFWTMIDNSGAGMPE